MPREVDDAGACGAGVGVVGGDDDDRVALGEAGEGVVDVVGSALVQLGGGFVHEEEVGSAGDGAGEHESLRLSSGQFAEFACSDLGQVERAHDGDGLVLGLYAVDALAEEGLDDVVDGGASGHAVGVLEHPAHAVDPVVPDGAFGWWFEAGDDRQEGGFAGAGRSAQADGLAGRESEVEVAEQPGAVREPVSHVFTRDRRRACGVWRLVVGRRGRIGVGCRVQAQDVGVHVCSLFGGCGGALDVVELVAEDDVADGGVGLFGLDERGSERGADNGDRDGPFAVGRDACTGAVLSGDGRWWDLDRIDGLFEGEGGGGFLAALVGEGGFVAVAGLDLVEELLVADPAVGLIEAGLDAEERERAFAFPEVRGRGEGDGGQLAAGLHDLRPVGQAGVQVSGALGGGDVGLRQPGHVGRSDPAVGIGFSGLREQLSDAVRGAPSVGAVAFGVVAEAGEFLLQGEHVEAGVAGVDLAVEGRVGVQCDDGSAVHGQYSCAGFDRLSGFAQGLADGAGGACGDGLFGAGLERGLDGSFVVELLTAGGDGVGARGRGQSVWRWRGDDERGDEHARGQHAQSGQDQGCQDSCFHVVVSFRRMLVRQPMLTARPAPAKQDWAASEVESNGSPLPVPAPFNAFSSLRPV